ncbi:hypothetical protein [Bradyrhizobium prioriisuperbiae]|uniref:hypothetical protein n=1 Tax=Bradyrhizobium prioriisuperbiae TaxID=2854389 RepID=UPI0028E91814|nr:hypothetical protein [Bradyrhizobium prioritasuperba]
MRHAARAAVLTAPQSSSTHRLLLALAAALALTAAIPSVVRAEPAATPLAKTQPVKAQSAKSKFAASTVTDFSAARRHRHVAYSARVRNAYGAVVGAPVYEAPSRVYETPSYGGGYGYGYGDNSRNQTW